LTRRDKGQWPPKSRTCGNAKAKRRRHGLKQEGNGKKERDRERDEGKWFFIQIRFESIYARKIANVEFTECLNIAKKIES
jgi:hypothetical protein